MSTKKIPIHEFIAPTIQGEGANCGKKTIFLRTQGCDYRCAWCDSKYTWKQEEATAFLTPQECVDQILDLSTKDGKRICEHVTFTGGNPALIEELGEVAEILTQEGFTLGIETQGSVFQEWFFYIKDFTVSPKPPSSKMPFSMPKFQEFCAKLEAKEIKFSIKIPIFDKEDLEFAAEVFETFPEVPQYLSVGNPYTEDGGDISQPLLTKLEWIWQEILGDARFNQTCALPQLHTLVWGNKKGV